MEWFVKALDDLVAGAEAVPLETLRDIQRVRAKLADSIGHLPRNPNFEELMARLRAAETLDQVAAAFVMLPREFGFEDATIAITREGQHRCLNRRVLSTLPPAWWQIYNDRRLYERDPVLAAAASGRDVVFTDEVVPPPPTPTPYLDAARSCGIGCDGVVFRVELATGLVAVMVMTGHATREKVRALWMRYEEDLRAAASAFCEALAHFSTIGVKGEFALSSEETRFLRLVVASEDPSEALKMHCMFGSPKTLQTSIMRKMGVKSIFQAVAMALRAGLLDGGGFEITEIVGTRGELKGWDLAQA